MNDEHFEMEKLWVCDIIITRRLEMFSILEAATLMSTSFEVNFHWR